MIRTIALFAFIAVFVSCGSNKNTNNSDASTVDYKSIAEKKLGEDVDYTFNEDESYVLCTYEIAGSAQQPRNNLYYMVINIANNTVVLENKVDGGTVSWYNQKMIQVYLTPGIMRKDQTRDDFITLYNVETGKSYPKNQKETH